LIPTPRRPITLAFSGDLISCAIIRKSGSGELRVAIKSAGGRVVAESSDLLPFGVVIALTGDGFAV